MEPLMGKFPMQTLESHNTGLWRIVVHCQAAKPKQRRCYAQETLLDGESLKGYAQETLLDGESLKGSNFLLGQCKATLSHV
jgi:hypothetical protein